MSSPAHTISRCHRVPSFGWRSDGSPISFLSPTPPCGRCCATCAGSATGRRPRTSARTASWRTIRGRRSGRSPAVSPYSNRERARALQADSPQRAPRAREPERALGWEGGGWGGGGGGRPPKPFVNANGPGGGPVRGGGGCWFPRHFETFGNPVNSGRLLMLLLHLASVFFLFEITRTFSGNLRAPLIATFFFNFSPLAIYYQREVLLDNVMVFWLLLSIYLLLRHVEELFAA